MLISVAASAARTSGLKALPRRLIDAEARAGERPDRLQYYALVLVALLVGLVQGCATPPERTLLPQDLYDKSQVPGIPSARYWGDEAPPYAESMMSMSSEELRARYPALADRPLSLLAISGGGSNGAFGAGLLNGWSDAGTRPEFSYVTGISTGSLIAPFAFLGPAYDDVLKEIYTTYSSKDLVKERGISGLFEIDALDDTAPLRAKLVKYVDEAVMQAIADEYRRGRLLLLGTTNLDAERPVIWNIGEIAISGAPGALDLIRDAMLASVSIPVAFPPTMMEVEADGQRYDEMHVDGGVTRQSFLFSFGVDNKTVAQRLGAVGPTKVYVIRNAKLEPQWQTVDRSIVDIAGRTVDSLIRTQGIGDLYREYLGVKYYGFDYNLAYIPASFDAESKELFDPQYMGKLYQLGYDLARRGYPWEEAPPGWQPQ
jgi:hypothetical protein